MYVYSFFLASIISATSPLAAIVILLRLSDFFLAVSNNKNLLSQYLTSVTSMNSYVATMLTLAWHNNSYHYQSGMLPYYNWFIIGSNTVFD